MKTWWELGIVNSDLSTKTKGSFKTLQEGIEALKKESNPLAFIDLWGETMGHQSAFLLGDTLTKKQVTEEGKIIDARADYLYRSNAVCHLLQCERDREVFIYDLADGTTHKIRSIDDSVLNAIHININSEEV